MRVLILTAIMLLYGGANYYTAVRIFRMLVLMGCNVSVTAFALTFTVISSTVILSFFRLKSGFRNVVTAVSSVWMGVILYLLIFTFLSDIVIFITGLTRNNSDRIKAAAEIVVLVLTLTTVAYGFLNAHHIKPAYYHVNTGNNSDPLRIVLISDIHVGALGIENRLAEMAEAVNKESPDIICISGDIFNNDYSSIKDPEAVTEAFKTFKPRFGTFACPGNHDCGSGFSNMIGILSDSGIKLLCENYSIVDGRCVIFGRSDSSPIGHTETAERNEFDIASCPEAAHLPVIVLDHNPANIKEYSDNVSLVLCGHTHKGQLFPGCLITGRMYDVDYGFEPSKDNKPNIIVTSGIGYWGPPLRIGSNSEIAVIDLT